MRLSYIHVSCAVLLAGIAIQPVSAFTTPLSTSPPKLAKSASLFPEPRGSSQTNYNSKSTTSVSASAAISSDDSSDTSSSNYKGLFTFKTKYGYLNPFAIYYGLTSILLGLPWFVALTACQLFYKITGNRVDKFRRIPSFVSQIWGIALLRLTRSYPKVEGREILDKFYKEGRATMIVANHNSWMDIPFLGACCGWRNYKFISKAELGKVPILGKSIAVGGHVMVDRTNRRSQLMTLKSGMQWLRDGVHLCTFPEGTRSKTGRVLPFKNGAFKMAHKVGAPVVPISIVAAGKAHPSDWMFPRRSSRGICKVIIHEPVESADITEDELAAAVRKSIIDGLPEDQHPLNE